MALVAIVGRPNVGKSTLFNRLVGMRQAIVDETAGVTRDRHYGKCEWNGREFSVVDTGGYTSNSDDVFEDAIRRQVGIAIDEADVVLFLCEAGTGITDYDMEIADLLRRSKKPVVLCVNKVDSGEKMYDAWAWEKCGAYRPPTAAAPGISWMRFCAFFRRMYRPMTTTQTFRTSPSWAAPTWARVPSPTPFWARSAIS